MLSTSQQRPFNSFFPVVEISVVLTPLFSGTLKLVACVLCDLALSTQDHLVPPRPTCNVSASLTTLVMGWWWDCVRPVQSRIRLVPCTSRMTHTLHETRKHLEASGKFLLYQFLQLVSYSLQWLKWSSSIIMNIPFYMTVIIIVTIINPFSFIFSESDVYDQADLELNCKILTPSHPHMWLVTTAPHWRNTLYFLASWSWPRQDPVQTLWDPSFSRNNTACWKVSLRQKNAGLVSETRSIYSDGGWAGISLKRTEDAVGGLKSTIRRFLFSREWDHSRRSSEVGWWPLICDLWPLGAVSKEAESRPDDSDRDLDSLQISW